jgi:tRNA/rRNA methyltransferase
VDEFTPLARIRIVLCEPSHPGNVGAAARALKTMGLERLDLVRPKLHPHPDADARASGALDVLRAARLHDHLDQALAGASFVCGLSARRRDLTPEVVDARAAARDVVAHARAGEAAILFGTERVGLSIAALSRCQRLVRIPANPAYASLNLAASVQVMAYELRCACMEAGATIPLQGSAPSPASHEDVERLVAHLEQTMRATGFLHPDRPGRLMQRMRRLLARARPEAEEVAILRGFLRSVSEREGR